ncbi:hypothetical protein [uncultured Roseobacter sp.]|uniref:hypothetical protein n=1 Tax=uncultured Roseobacter sp. TaxID=114847 RepID=UPI00261EA184|nr:hypothetical protein [uncultured Roseobacter sp.]
MRKLKLTDEEGYLRHDAFYATWLLGVYPYSEDDYNRALLLFDAEQERFSRMGLDGYKPSAFVKPLLQQAFNRAGWRATAGFFALSILKLKEKGMDPTQDEAAEVVSEMANVHDTAQFAVYRDGKFSVKNRKLVNDTVTIKKRFRSFQSAAHICAAFIVFSSHHPFPHPFNVDPEVDERFVATLLHFQRALRCAIDTSSWNMWEINENIRFKGPTPEPFEITDALLEYMMAPWEATRGRPPGG